MAFDLGAIGSGVGGLVSLGTGIEGALIGSKSAKDAARDEGAIASLDEQADAQRRTAMELQVRRAQTQSVRQEQLARSMALTQATAGGSQFGTGLQGAYGQIAGQTSTNQLAQSQNLQTGEKIFDINAQIDQAKIELAKDQAGIAEGSAISSLGSSIGKSLGPLGNLFSSLPGMFA